MKSDTIALLNVLIEFTESQIAFVAADWQSKYHEPWQFTNRWSILHHQQIGYLDIYFCFHTLWIKAKDALSPSCQAFMDGDQWMDWSQQTSIESEWYEK